MSASILESSKSNNYSHTEGTSLLAKRNSAQNAQIASSSLNFLNDAKTFVIDNFLLVSFSVALLFALIYPSAGKLVHSWSVGSFVVMELLNYLIVFFISGFTLKLEELKAVVKHRIPIAYSLIAINVVTTFLGFILIRFPYLINEFQIGETIFACVPTTLGEFLFRTSRSLPVNYILLFLLRRGCGANPSSQRRHCFISSFDRHFEPTRHPDHPRHVGSVSSKHWEDQLRSY